MKRRVTRAKSKTIRPPSARKKSAKTPKRAVPAFVNREQIVDLTQQLHDDDEVQILCALSGG
jgi:molybdopterin converting factor small subunit